jgi:prepilin-type N-terminal cleavage/methylation domain-containing protein
METGSKMRIGDNNFDGFTMVELLVALLLAAIVTSASMALYTTQQKQFLVQDQISDMQSSIRAATGELAEKVRQAGFKVPPSIVAISGSNTNPDSISIAYDAGTVGNIQIEHAMTQVSGDLRCDGHDLTGLYDNDWLYIFDPSANTGEYFIATSIQYATSLIQHASNLGRAYPLGSKILKIRRFEYYIDQTDPNHPNMMIKANGNAAQIYAENITNINFTYILSSGASADVPLVPDMIREVKITVQARNDKTDNEFFSQYRTRILTTRVKVRNLGVN